MTTFFSIFFYALLHPFKDAKERRAELEAERSELQAQLEGNRPIEPPGRTPDQIRKRIRRIDTELNYL